MAWKKGAVTIIVAALLLALAFSQFREKATQPQSKELKEIPEGRPIVLPNMPDPYGDEGLCEATPFRSDEPSYYPVPVGASFYGQLRDAKVLRHCDIQLVFYTGGRFMSRDEGGEIEGMPYSAVNLYFAERALVYELRLDRWYYVEVNATGFPVVLRPVPESEVKGTEGLYVNLKPILSLRERFSRSWTT